MDVYIQLRRKEYGGEIMIIIDNPPGLKLGTTGRIALSPKEISDYRTWRSKNGEGIGYISDEALMGYVMWLAGNPELDNFVNFFKPRDLRLTLYP